MITLPSAGAIVPLTSALDQWPCMLNSFLWSMLLKAHGLLQTISAELETMYVPVLGGLLGALLTSVVGPDVGSARRSG